MIVAATGAEGRAAVAPRAAAGDAHAAFALGAGASFASTLGSTWLIRQVERDRSLAPYAAYRLALAGLVTLRGRART